MDYWKPQILKHTLKNGKTEYAIHEVYFNSNDEVETWTQDAISDRFKTKKLLKASLIEFINSGKESIVCGDKKYSYSLNNVKFWLEYVEDKTIDYKS